MGFGILGFSTPYRVPRTALGMLGQQEGTITSWEMGTF